MEVEVSRRSDPVLRVVQPLFEGDLPLGEFHIINGDVGIPGIFQPIIPRPGIDVFCIPTKSHFDLLFVYGGAETPPGRLSGEVADPIFKVSAEVDGLFHFLLDLTGETQGQTEETPGEGPGNV